MKTLSSIEIVFENCESFTLPADVIGNFVMKGFNREIARIACNCIGDTTFVDVVAMEIFQEGDTLYRPFETEEQRSKFQRILTWNDITHIEVEFSDKSRECFSVDWESEDVNDTSNKYQKTMLSEIGNLYIVISKDHVLYDFFDPKSINDVRHIE